jgi:hypothetical protein
MSFLWYSDMDKFEYSMVGGVLEPIEVIYRYSRLTSYCEHIEPANKRFKTDAMIVTDCQYNLERDSGRKFRKISKGKLGERWNRKQTVRST